MNTNHPSIRTLLFALLSSFLLFGLSVDLQAQTKTQTYTLDNVWLLPDISDPLDPPMQMTGSFQWTYPVGSFENGVGSFTAINIPWYGTDFNALDIFIDLTSIEFVLPGAGGGTGLDITFFLQTDLDPNLPSTITLGTSLFEVQEFGVTHQGHVQSGTILPDAPISLSVSGTCPNLQFQVDGASGNSQIALLWATGLGSTVIPGGRPCAGTLLGLTGTISLGVMLQSDASGQVTLNTTVPPRACGTVWLQALNLETCRVSNTLLVQ